MGHGTSILFAIVVNEEIAAPLEPSLCWMVDELLHAIQHLAARIDHLARCAPRDGRADESGSKRGHEERDFLTVAKANHVNRRD
jgi:hypothetical protein